MPLFWLLALLKGKKKNPYIMSVIYTCESNHIFTTPLLGRQK